MSPWLVHGKEHESVAVNLYNLALNYEAQKDKTSAEPLYREALKIGEKVFKPDDKRLKMMRDKSKE